MAPRFHTLLIKEIRRETPDAVSVAFEVPDHLKDAYRFTPGQYLTLKREVDGREMRRSYSICSGLDDPDLRIAVKRIEGGRFSGFVNRLLAPGEAIEVMTPMGRFGLEPNPDAERTYVALACGSGITPILSIVKSILAHEPGSRFLLLYGNRTTNSILFREELEDLKDRFLDRLTIFHVLSRETQDLPILSGRLDGDRITRLLGAMVPADSIDHAFICGPSAMLDEAGSALRRLGLRDEQIHVERFTPAEDAPVRAETKPVEPIRKPAAVAEILLDGRRHQIPVGKGETVLEAALRTGLDLPYSCRGGMCCTCRAKVVEGEVEMAVNYSLEPWELEAGFALTCQSHPRSERLVVDYDQV